MVLRMEIDRNFTEENLPHSSHNIVMIIIRLFNALRRSSLNTLHFPDPLNIYSKNIDIFIKKIYNNNVAAVFSNRFIAVKGGILQWLAFSERFCLCIENPRIAGSNPAAAVRSAKWFWLPIYSVKKYSQKVFLTKGFRVLCAFNPPLQIL